MYELFINSDAGTKLFYELHSFKLNVLNVLKLNRKVLLIHALGSVFR